MLDAVSKPAPGDPFVITQPRQPYLKEVGAPAGKLRIAFTTESWTGNGVNSELAVNVHKIARLCQNMGHFLEASKPQFDLEAYFSAIGVMWNASLGFACDQLA